LATPQYRLPEIIPKHLFAVRKAGAIVEKNIYKVLLVFEPLLCNVRAALMQCFAFLSDAISPYPETNILEKMSWAQARWMNPR